MLIEKSSTLVKNSQFFQNSCGDDKLESNGGAIKAKLNTELKIVNCSFMENSCYIFGGAIYLYRNSKVEITDSKMINNFSKVGGSAIYGIN